MKIKKLEKKDNHLLQLEELNWKQIDKLDSQLDPLKNFILPGGSRGAAVCHLARTICRRAERTLVSLNKAESVSSYITVYINRLSDYLFVLARIINKGQNITDIPWKKD